MITGNVIDKTFIYYLLKIYWIMHIFYVFYYFILTWTAFFKSFMLYLSF
jgi:hypothetical protein